MPYVHKNCGGEIRWFPPLPIPPTCKKCRKVWNPLVIYGRPPKDMFFQAPQIKTPQLKRGDTTYMRWADSFPVAAFIASHMPNWPRPLRVVVTLGLITIAVLLITKC